MLPRVNTCRCADATVCLVSTAILGLSAAFGAALIAAPALGDSQVAREPVRPDAADVVSAYLTARRWVDRFELPPLDDEASRVPIAGATGACVQLRRSGRVLGSGIIVPSPLIDSDLIVRRAVGRAMSHVLGDSAVSRLPDDLQDEVGGSLILELEIAGALEPMLVRSFDQLARHIEPGLEGVALRRGEQWAMLFPSQLLATNSADALATRAAMLLDELDVPAADLNTLIEQHNVAVYQFRTSHLVQTGPGQQPFETFRGDRLVLPGAVTRETISDAAEALVKHILTHTWPDESTDDLPRSWQPDQSPALLGSYRPVADRYQPLTAPPFEQAIISFALARVAAVSSISEETASDAGTSAVRILQFLIDTTFSEEAEHAQARAAALYAVGELQRLNPERVRVSSETGVAESWRADLEAWAQHATDLLLAVLRRGLENERNVTASNHDPHARALIVGALARQLAHRDDAAVELPLLRRALDDLWERLPPHAYVMLLPWIGWAELDVARQDGDTIAHADRLEQVRAALYEVQVGADDVDTDRDQPADLHGGFVFTDNRRPDAQSIRTVVWLSAMLRDERLTAEGARHMHEQRLRAALRFLLQLTIRDAAMWSLRNPGRAVGGVRNACWDNNLPLAAQALGLLALAEALEALDADW